MLTYNYETHVPEESEAFEPGLPNQQNETDIPLKDDIAENRDKN